MSAKITLELGAIPPVISQSVHEVLEALGLRICRTHSSYASELYGQELDDVLREIGNNTAGCLLGIEVAPDAAPTTPAASEPGCPHTMTLIDVNGRETCRDCGAVVHRGPMLAAPRPLLTRGRR